jgi:class 3 adenylate cyclase
VADIPETQFATLGEDRINFQVFGEGDVDLVYLPGFGDAVDLRWDWPPYAGFLRELGSHTRVIMFDRGGSAGSDAPSGDALPGWERWADEARAVMDAAASERAVIFGHSPGSGPIAILFAVTHPARTRGLVLGNTTARYAAAPDYPGGAVSIEASARWVRRVWGSEAQGDFALPDASRDPSFRHWFAKSARLALTPSEAGKAIEVELSLDVRDSLASLRVPTLILHREGFTAIPQSHSRYLAEHIPGARFALVPGNDGGIWAEPKAEVLHQIAEFLHGLHGETEPDRALAAVLFTDIVESTARAASMGDREWRHLLETHDAVARTVVEQHRGRLVKTTGDGMLATFDGPGRAIRCAVALGDALRPLGLEIRAGLHTGEVEMMGTDIAGIGVHIAARVLEAASPGDVVVSAAVPMLVAGSGFEFDDRGEHELKGVPGTWKLFSVRG